MTRLLMLAAAILTAAPAQAGSCGVVYPIQSYSTVKHAVQDYHAEKRITVLEYVPLYFVGNAPGYTAPAPAATAPTTASPCDAKVSALEAKLAALEAKLSASAPAEKPVPVQPEPVTAPPSKSVLATECAACHDRATRAKGDGVELSADGKALLASAEMTGKIIRYVSSGKCPRGKPLPGDRFTALLQELVDMHSK